MARMNSSSHAIVVTKPKGNLITRMRWPLNPEVIHLYVLLGLGRLPLTASRKMLGRLETLMKPSRSYAFLVERVALDGSRANRKVGSRFRDCTSVGSPLKVAWDDIAEPDCWNTRRSEQVLPALQVHHGPANAGHPPEFTLRKSNVVPGLWPDLMLTNQNDGSELFPSPKIYCSSEVSPSCCVDVKCKFTIIQILS
jgi:hypothetical protein